ncbi:MAG: sugar ABC transporter substrate-binding protein [Betaproteobacteria bacterium]|jgi:ABC-type sugar transport system substrate-binding protein|nr:sugar ABC transporter substrate-binding protein [Rhodocyclaceae bacterium]MCA3134562.1 sugar ABC transporter substrate-binding protein [Rhodocyclaceae bacterium]MCA3143637.1 sugar ABC transporter substrate-binding protein [Rhodocyclaceae bacterium]MCA3145499.1 sugar ABC transporter substrate-binding protein [Rhodocyclaceae bacterium]MCE2898919.1 sugar ABC transporter substrate-binding protein [Betaproteobacteria bacterium]
MYIHSLSLKPLAAGVAVAAALCVSSGAALAAKKSTDKLNVAVVAVNYNSPTIQEMSDTVMADCKKRGWTCELHDGKGDQVATNNAAINFINRKFDAIINIASDNNQMGAVIKAANAASIPFVSAFSGDVPGVTADIGASGAVDGVIVGNEMKSSLDYKGHVVLFNWNVLPTLRDRTQGVKAALFDAKGIKVTEVEVKVPGQVEDVLNRMRALLQANKDINGVIVGWDELGPPAVRAIEEAGLAGKVRVMGMDGIQPVYDLMRKGNSSYVMSVAYSKRSIALKTSEVVASVIDGKKVPFRALMTRTCVVTKDTLPAAGQDPDFSKCTPFTGEVVAK